MNNTSTQQGLSALKAGNKDQARQLFSKALSQNKKDVRAWLGLSLVIDDQRKQRICLQRVLELEPDNRYAQKWLARLDSESRVEAPPEAKDEPVSASTSTAKRFSLASIKQSVLGKPHLPLLPILLLVLLLLTEMFLMLIGQYTGYWHNFAAGNVGSSTIASLLTLTMRTHPLLFILLMLGYASIIALLLRYLAFAPALILWMVVFAMHLQSVLKWGRCSLSQSFQLSAGSCNTIAMTSMLVIGIVMGAALAMVLWPRGTAVADSRAQKEPKLSSWMFAAGGIWVFVLVAWLAYRIFIPVEGWVPIAFENGPPGRASTAVAYDTDRETAVIFGGASEFIGPAWNDWTPLDDTWEWDGQKWAQKQPQNSPSPRFAHQMAYDPIRKVTVLFGGESEQGSLADTWEWDGENWHLQSPSTSPQARCCGNLFFDPQRGKVILTSGLQTPHNFWPDVWEWDGNDWQYVETHATVPLSSGYPFSYHEKQNEAVGLLLDETWVWDSAAWHYKPQTIMPPARSDSAMAYDPVREQIFLYGGCTRDSSGCTMYNDTWIYDGEAWQEIKFPQNSPSISRHVLFYDYKRDRIMLYGGYQNGATQALLWELNLPDE